MTPAYICPVCGYPLPFPPLPQNHDICPCCAVEFGYDDSGVSHATLRGCWLASGAKWWCKSEPAPEGWAARYQLLKAFGPEELRKFWFFSPWRNEVPK